jgi:putative ATP-dependent endonuclease of OLD family
MRLAQIKISNYRRCKDVSLTFGPMHALVGSNNAGKSTILRALDFLFNASVKSLNDEAFWNGNTEEPIRVEALFTDLSEVEKEQLGPYLREDGSFLMARLASKTETTGNDESEQSSAFKISQQYSKRQPIPSWLRRGETNGANITQWLKEPDSLQVNGESFFEFIGSPKKFTVGDWNAKAEEFAAAFLTDSDYEDGWGDNPSGYAGVLKGILPFFVLVPAVRDISDEAKVLKTNPFGRLLAAVIEAIASEKKAELVSAIQSVTRQLNRVGGDDRLPQIGIIETELNAEIAKIFDKCDIEIEFQTPDFEALMGTPRLFVNDGFRGQVEFKGHGLQRAVIFSILRNYADVVIGKGDLKRRNLILAVEEPELYMHPLAQRAIRKLFKEISGSGDQVFYTTHSATQVEVADFDEVIRLEGSPIELPDGKTTVCTTSRQLSAESMVDDELARHPFLRGRITASSIREHYSHAYNRSRNEGFFAKKVILVEGDTEEYSLPIYASALGVDLDVLGISVIEAGGKGQMDRLFRIFNELGIPVFMVLDYDDGNAQAEIVKKSEELLELLEEPTGVPTDFYLGPKAACFQKNWEVSFEQEVPDYGELNIAATRELGGVAGKPIRARFIARTLAKRTPAFIPPRIESIIRAAIEVECGPSCLRKPTPEPTG